jgi:hypothetical protein
MAIIAYASGSANPTVSQVRPIIDLNDGDTLPADVNLYGGAIDSLNGGATFSFSWHLLKKPAGSNAQLSNSFVANPVLQDVDVWGNYRLFLIATNVSTGVTSERDPLKAPNSAFIQLGVKSENKALEKPAIGERDWNDRYNHSIDVLEQVGIDLDALETTVATLNFSDLDDVNVDEPANNEVLIYQDGFWVNGTSASNPVLTAKAEGANAQTLTLTTDVLNLKGTANEVEVSIAKNGTSVDYTIGLPSNINVNATTATQLVNVRQIAVSGAVTGSAGFSGASNATIVTTIPEDSIANSKLVNKGISVSDATTSEVIALGDELRIIGTVNEVNAVYTSADNTFTISLPSNISANASTASDLKDLNTTGIVKRTGASTFTTTSNLDDLSDVVAGGAGHRDVLMFNTTANPDRWQSATIKEVLNRSTYPMPINGYFEGHLFDADVDAAAANHQQSVFSWYNYTGETVTVAGYSMIVGVATNGASHTFRLYQSGDAWISTNTLTAVVGSTLVTTGNAKLQASNRLTLATALPIPAGEWIHVVCDTTDAKNSENRISTMLHSFISVDL